MRGYFKTMILAFSMAVSINFGRIFRYMLRAVSLGENPRFEAKAPDFSTILERSINHAIID